MLLECENVSIIIPTVVIDSLTKRCVDQCHNFFPKSEIIVLTDTEHNKDTIQAKVINCSKKSIAAKRNIGASLSKREVLAFIDSDAMPAQKWLTSALDVFNTESFCQAVAGPNIAPLDSPYQQLLVGTIERSNLITINAHYIKMPGKPRKVGLMPACNFLINRKTYLDLGGMNESLFGGEDFDFCKKMMRQKIYIEYRSSVLVFHKCRDLLPFIKKRISYGGFAFDNASRTISLPILLSILPAFICLFLFTFPLVFTWYLFAIFYWSVLSFFGFILLFESIRISQYFRQVPIIFPLLLIGVLAPGIGSLAKMLRILPDYSKIYRNFD